MRTIKVKGMSCAHCASAVSKTLSEIQGISDVKVDLRKGEVSFNEVQPVETGFLKERITKAGYDLG